MNPKAPVKPTTYLDEGEAARVAWDYIEGIARGLVKPRMAEIHKADLGIGGGGVVSLYYHEVLIAQAVIVRNSLNRSILTCHDYRETFSSQK